MAIAKDHAGELEGSVDYRDFVNKSCPTIVQIGAHDGILGEEYGFQEFLDSIEDFKLTLVEPLSPYFDNLINVYGKYKEKVSYCKHAITETHDISFMVENGCMSRIDVNGTIKVKSKTWDTFINDMLFEKIDLLLLDCEGYEYQIISNIDFEKMSPKIIRYEYKHIIEKEACDALLRSKGYRIEFCKFDHTYNKIAIL